MTPAVPAMPPSLKRPWNPDIIGRPLGRSTMIAWMSRGQTWPVYR